VDPEHHFYQFWDESNARTYSYFLQDISSSDKRASIVIRKDEVRGWNALIRRDAC
jgi:hypothetical protein